MSRQELDMILREAYLSMREIFSDKLIAAILYGSYARGDFDAESDIDIALLVDASREELKQYQHTLVSQMSYFMMQYDVLVNFTEIPIKDFEEFKDVLPYYRNIDREGVRLSA